MARVITRTLTSAMIRSIVKELEDKEAKVDILGFAELFCQCNRYKFKKK